MREARREKGGAIGVFDGINFFFFKAILSFVLCSLISPVIPATAHPMCPSSWYIFSLLTPIALVSRSCCCGNSREFERVFGGERNDRWFSSFDRCFHHSFFFLPFALFSPVPFASFLLQLDHPPLERPRPLEQDAHERSKKGENTKKTLLFTLDVIRFSAASTTPSLASTPSAAPALLMASIAYSTW